MVHRWCRLQPGGSSFIPLYLLQLAFLIPLTVSTISIPPILEEGPPKGEILFHVSHYPEQESENLTIPCRADAFPMPSYSWFKDGNHFNTDVNNITVVEGEGTLVFTNPQPEDEGCYQCSATNSAGSVYSNFVSVKRAVTISFPKGEPRVVTAILGQPLALECANPGGYPVPSLHWVLQKSDGSLRSVSSERATVDEEGTLWFGAVTLEDASEDALYACAASSATRDTLVRVLDLSGRTEYRMGNWVYLNVTAPHSEEGGVIMGEAQVQPFSQHVSEEERTVLVGEDLKLFCIYGGIPTPKVKWWRADGVQIPADNFIEYGKVLHFPEVTAYEEGTFFCQATSEVGEGSVHSFKVAVEYTPVFEKKPGKVNQPPGESAIFSCSASGEPSPTITWSFNGEPLEEIYQKETLKFDSLSKNNTGVIACNASNKHGYVYSAGYLNVLSVSPEFTKQPEDVSGFAGKRIILPCGGYGAPDPEMEWAKVSDSGTEDKISEDDERYTLSDESLVIKSVSDETSGTYKCNAVNKFGFVSTTVYVKLIMSTSVNVHSSSTITKVGDTVNIYCDVTVDENLSADVTWMKDDSPMDFSNPRISRKKGDSDDDDDDDDDSNKYDHILTISDAMGSDAGVYSCISKTDQDQAEDFVIIIVEDVPTAPEIDEVECTGSKAYLYWSSKGENSSPIIGYIIQTQTEHNKNKWEDIQNEIPASKTSSSVVLHPSLTHIFRVIAQNRVGASEPSLSSNPCVAVGAPPYHNPRITNIETVDSSTLQVTWDAIEPKEHNGPDFRYEISWKRFTGRKMDKKDDNNGGDNVAFMENEDDSDDWSKLVIEDWEQTEVQIDGLRPHTRYRVRVAAVNEHGAAPRSQDRLIYTEAGVPDAAPTFLRVRRVSDTTAILFWVPVPSNLVFGPLKGYEIDIWKVGEERDDDDGDQEEDGNDDLITTGPTSRAYLTELEPYTEYEARVRVLNKMFPGPFTETIKFRTWEGDPSPVVDLKARSLSSSTLIVKWDPPTQPRGIITDYIIQYQPIYEEEGGPVMKTMTNADAPLVKLSDLVENSLYRITVSAKNARRLGKQSEVKAQTEETESSLPVPPVFSVEVLESAVSTTTTRSLFDRDNDGDIDEDDERLQDVILKDTDGDGDVDQYDILDTDNDGDIDDDDFNVADINNDSVVDRNDVVAGDRDGDGDVDKYDIGDEDGNGVFDIHDVLIADEDGDGDIDASDDDGENVILEDVDGNGKIDENDATDFDGDGDIDEYDLNVLDTDNDGDIDEDDVKLLDRDRDGDIDGADVLDLDEDGKIDADDLAVKDVDNDGDIDRMDYIYRLTFLADTDGDGDIDSDDVLDIDRDGDIDDDDLEVADINNDDIIDINDVKAADRDADGDVDANDIGDEDGDGDIDVMDLLIADEDHDGDIDAKDDDGEGILFEDRDGDGDLDNDDVTDMDGDGDVDEDDIAILDVNDDGKIDADDLAIIDKDGDGDVDSADVVDFNGDGKIDEYDLKIVDKDGDGDIDARDIAFQHVYLKDIDGDGDIDSDDVLDLDGDGDVDEHDEAAADLDDDGDVDEDDLTAFDRDFDGDIDKDDIKDFDGDRMIDEDDFDVTDRDGDGDIDEQDYALRNIFLKDTDGDGDVDEDDVLDTDNDGDIDDDDFDVADINNDGKVDENDVRAGDVDGDGDVDISDIGDEDNDGDIDGKDVIAADEDGDGDIDAEDDDGEFILLTDRDNDGDIDENDVSDINGDGAIDEADIRALDINNDGNIDEDDLKRGDKDGDGDIDAADITDLDGDGDVDANDIIISDRDGDGDIDESDRRNKDLILGDADGDGDVDSEDILDTDRDGDIDGDDFAAADINNDEKINIDDVLAADQDGDGDVDADDIGDIDGDGDVDADDMEARDRDGDGDIDLADKGEGIDINVNWRPDFESHPGSEFYIKYRPVGEQRWKQSPVEEKSLHQKLRGLDRYTAYEIQMVAKDGEFETPSNISVIGPFAHIPGPPITENPVKEAPVGAVMNDADLMLMTWFIVAVMVAVTMICIVFFSIWVYNQRLSRVSELRAQLYEGYEPPPVVEKKAVDVEAALPESDRNDTDEPLTAEKQRQQMSALLKRQETIQSVDSFASHDDDFAEYGDETMAIDLLNSISLITNPRRQGQQPNA